jgi:hypothetical protein
LFVDDLDAFFNQILSAFLTLVSLDPENRSMIESSYFLSMRTLERAPTYSPLKRIDWTDVMRTTVDMLQNLDKRASNGEDKPAQEAFTYKLLDQLTKPESTADDEVPVLHAKALNFMELPLQRFQTIGTYLSGAKKVLAVRKRRERKKRGTFPTTQSVFFSYTILFFPLQHNLDQNNLN